MSFSSATLYGGNYYATDPVPSSGLNAQSSTLYFRGSYTGQTSPGTLALINVNHADSSADNKGQMIIQVSDGTTLSSVMTMTSTSVTMADIITTTGNIEAASNLPLYFYVNSSVYLSITTAGQVYVVGANNTTKFAVQNSAGTNVLSVATSTTANNNQVTVNGQLYVPMSAGSATHPAILLYDGTGSTNHGIYATSSAIYWVFNGSNVVNLTTSAFSANNSATDLGAASAPWGSVYSKNLFASSLATLTVPYVNANQALVSSAVTATELSYVHGVTSAIQTQLNARALINNPVFTGIVTIPSGSSSTSMGLTFTGFTGVGIYASSSTFNIVAGQTLVGVFNMNYISFPVTLYIANGGYKVPGISFQGDHSSGLYLPSSGVFGIAAGGVACIETASTYITCYQLLRPGSTSASITLGSAAIPWSNIYGVNIIPTGATKSTAAIIDASGYVASSVTTLTELSYVSGVTSAIQTQINARAPIDSPVFTTLVTLPSGTSATVLGVNFAGFTTTGFYAVSGALNVVVGGQLTLGIDTTFMSVAVPIQNASGSATAPAYSFTASTNTGIYLAAAGDVRVAAGGADVLQLTGSGIVASQSITPSATGTLALGSTGAVWSTVWGNVFQYSNALTVTTGSGSANATTIYGEGVIIDGTAVTVSPTGIMTLSGTNSATKFLILDGASATVMSVSTVPDANSNYAMTANGLFTIVGSGTTAIAALSLKNNSSGDTQIAFTANGSATGSLTFNAGGTFTITNPILAYNGTPGAPAYSFVNDTASGIFLQGGGDMRLSAGGTAVIRFTGPNTIIFNNLLAENGQSLNIGNGTTPFNYLWINQITLAGGTPSTAVYLDSSRVIRSSATTSTELGYVSGVTSAIQTQIDAKAPINNPTFTGYIWAPTGTSASALGLTFATHTGMGFWSESGVLHLAVGATAFVDFNGNNSQMVVTASVVPGTGTWNIGSPTALYNSIYAANATFSTPAGGTYITMSGSNSNGLLSTYLTWENTYNGATQNWGVDSENNYRLGVSSGTTTAGSGVTLLLEGYNGSSLQTGAIWFDGQHLFLMPSSTGVAVNPGYDNTFSCGGTSYRWTAVYAVNGTIQTSDAREKNTIQPSQLGLDFISRMEPVSYKFNSNTKATHYGLVAQQVGSVLDELAIAKKDFAAYDEDPKTGRLGLIYTEFVPILIQAVKELKKIVEDQGAEITRLQERILQ